MSRERKTLAGPEKLAILRRYLVEKVPISDLCDQYSLQPSQIYYWQAQLFEHGASIFERKAGRQASAQSAKGKKRCQEPIRGFLGRSGGRTIDSKLNRRAACTLHDSSPYGLPRCTLRRTACNSASVCGAFT